MSKFNFFRSFSSSASSQAKSPLLNRYYALLKSKYPLADPTSLIASFLILHEVTAIVPLFLGFCAFNSIGLGESILQKITVPVAEAERTWMGEKMVEWIKEGEEQGEKIGRRYGVLGYEKESKEQRELRKASLVEGIVSSSTVHKLGGGVGDLIAAYLLVKVTLPLRVLLSVRLAPIMANSVVGRIKSLREIGKKWLKKSNDS